jgi:aryl-alcohol dehydrogenase-like predicted oxidoreductase
VAEARLLAQHRELAPVTAYQQRYSYLQPVQGTPVDGQPLLIGMLSEDGLELLRRTEDIAGRVYTPLLLGAYDRSDRLMPSAYEHPGNARRLAALGAVATQRGLTRSQVVLAWLAGGHPKLTAIVGVSSVSHVDQACAGVATQLTVDERASLDAAF